MTEIGNSRPQAERLGIGLTTGEEFTVTRDGQPIAELIPLRRGQRFVSRAAFARASQTAPVIDLEKFERDQDFADDELCDPYV